MPTIRELRANFVASATGMTSSLQNVQEEVRRISESAQETSQNMTRSLGGAARTTERNVTRSMTSIQNSGRDMSRAMNNLDPFRQLERETRQLQRTIGRPIENLPRHLEPFRDSLNETRQELIDVGRTGQESIDTLARATTRSVVSASQLTSVTDSGKKAAKSVQKLAEETRTAQLAIMGLNEDGTIAIDSDEANRRLQRFQDEVADTRQELERLRDAGDMGSYLTGMRQVELSLLDVDNAMRATSRGGRTYQNMLREMGIYTSDTANQMAIDMERFRGSFLRNLDIMNSRSTLSKKMMDFLPDTSMIQGIDRFFLGVSNRLETIAQRGSAANLAIEMLGRDAPMKKIMDLTRMINQGVMGVQQVAIAGTVVFGLFTAAMATAASGPSPSAAAEEAGKALAKYQEEVQKRADEIMNTWNVFMDVQLKAISPEPLRENLQEQVDIMTKWEQDLNDLEKRTQNVELMQYLRGLGPEAAMEIQALNDHTDEGLSEWVKLWEEKSRIATRAAMTELEWMKAQTDAEIDAIMNSITPLSIAWENFLQTWTRAFGPFVETWGIIAAKVVDGATAIGKFINKINELNPQITAMIGMFAYLFTGLTVLLAPLGVGIGLLKGMRANFNALFLMIKPGVVAFFRIAGAATVISAALVILGTVMYNLWKNSERLREVLTTAFQIIQAEVSGAIAQIQPHLTRLKDAFYDMVQTFLGEGKTLKDIWTLIGDSLGNMISNVMTKYLPAFKNGLSNMVLGAVTIINWLIDSFKSISKWWNDNGSAIGGAVKLAFGAVTTVLSEVVGFIGSVLSKIVGFFKSDGAVILAAATNIFQGIYAVIKFVMPAVLWLIKSIWNNIKGVINGALNVIMGAIKLFAGIFTGDFGKMWEGIKQLFFGAIQLIINLVSLMFYGKILGGVKIFVVGMKNSLGAMWEAIKSLFKGGGSVAWNYIKRAWSDILTATKTIIGNVVTYIKDTFNSIISISKGLFTGAKLIFKNGWNAILNATSLTLYKVGEFIMKLWNGIRDFLYLLVDDIVKITKGAWNKVWDSTKYIFGLVFKSTKDIFTNVYKFFKDIFKTIFDFLFKIIDRIYITFSAGWQNIKISTQDNFRYLYRFFKDIWGTIRDFIKGAVSGIYNRIKDTWRTVKDNTVSTFRDIYNAIRNRFNDIVTRAKELPGKIGDGIKSMASRVNKGITALINTMTKTLGKGVNGVIKGINWVLDKLKVDIEIDLWDVPKYEHGTHKHGGHPGGPAIINDGKGRNSGKELVIDPDGTTWMAKGRNVLVDLAQGAQVLSVNQMKDLQGIIPQYKDGIIKKTLGKAWDSTTALGNKVKDKAFDVFNYLKNPSGLLDAGLKALGIEKPSGSSISDYFAKGGWNFAKDGAIKYVKNQLKSFSESMDGSAFAPGSGKGSFGAPFRRSSGYGPRSRPGGFGSAMHRGIDYAAPIGTPIPSQSAGIVEIAGYHPIRGNYVKVKSGNMSYIYQHNTRNLVSRGQIVKKGQIVGTVGSTGSSTGPHLHYEVARNGVNFNPDLGGMGGTWIPQALRNTAGKFNEFADGGFKIDQKQLAWIADGGFAESIISHDPNKRVAQQQIWQKTGEDLGFTGDNAEMVELLRRMVNAMEEGHGHPVFLDKDQVGYLMKDIITSYQETDTKIKKLYKK